MRRVAARNAWTTDGLVGPTAVVLNGQGQVVELGPATPEDGLLDGILMPGLVNAHTHLELAHHPKVVGTPGLGSPGWVGALFQSPAKPTPDTAERGARRLRALGTGFVIDTSNAGDTAPAIASARLQGTVLVECIGVHADRWAPALDRVPTLPTATGVHVRPTAHSPVSCSPDLLATALRAGPAPVTLHCDEDPADAALLADRTGPWVAFHGRIAARVPTHTWRESLGQSTSGVALLDQLGLLGPHVGLVHLTAASEQDLDRVAAAGCTAVLCPRSNQHITGRLPNVPAMVARGIPLALGTDSRASTPDFDVLAEASALHLAFPNLPATTWLHALSTGGGGLLSQGAGPLRVGADTGVVLFQIPPDPDPAARLLDGTRWPRRWLT